MHSNEACSNASPYISGCLGTIVSGERRGAACFCIEQILLYPELSCAPLMIVPKQPKTQGNALEKSLVSAFPGLGMGCYSTSVSHFQTYTHTLTVTLYEKGHMCVGKVRILFVPGEVLEVGTNCSAKSFKNCLCESDCRFKLCGETALASTAQSMVWDPKGDRALTCNPVAASAQDKLVLS